MATATATATASSNAAPGAMSPASGTKQHTAPQTVSAANTPQGGVDEVAMEFGIIDEVLSERTGGDEDDKGKEKEKDGDS